MYYIGNFNVKNSSILIGDPMATMVAAQFYGLDSSNLRRMRFNNVSNGEWSVYHVHENFIDDALLVINENMLSEDIVLEYSVSDCISNLNLKRYGKICTAFGKAVFVVDGTFFNKPQYSYFSFYENVLYDIDELLKIPALEHDIFEKINSYMNDMNKHHIPGEIIAEYVYNEKLDISTVNSNLWSVDAVERANHSLYHASVIKGGIVNCTDSAFCSCYANNDNPSCILICLNDNIEIKNTSNYYPSNIIEFPH